MFKVIQMSEDVCPFLRGVYMTFGPFLDCEASIISLNWINIVSNFDQTKWILFKILLIENVRLKHASNPRAYKKETKYDIKII